MSALHTVTFGRYKPAFFTPGGARAGEVHLVDIGVSRTGHDLAELPGVGELAGWMPRRSLHAYKQSSGHLAVLAGSPEMAGAAVLTCTGAIRAGVGLVTLFIDEKALGRLGALPPTVMVVPGAASASLPNVGAFSALAVGPGLGGGRLLSSELRTALAAHLLTEQPIVADADALHPGMQVGPHVVITPHPGEAGRILGCTSQQVQADRFSAVQELPGVALLKGRHTLVHGPNNRISINPTNSSVLATAGSGDVLTGVIGALLAQGVPPFKAAQLGAWLHGRSGELLASKRATGWSALDIAQALPEAAQELLDVSP